MTYPQVRFDMKSIKCQGPRTNQDSSVAITKKSPLSIAVSQVPSDKLSPAKQVLPVGKNTWELAISTIAIRVFNVLCTKKESFGANQFD